ncbi:MAG: hypothetical protein IKM88_10630, partial [Lachnospiraceae bacterium]|nr:hypothetical protein [Lachnospiraceae bacterium]
SRAKVGIRVNVPTELFLKDDIGYQEDGFRFGFDVESGAFEHALHVICSAIDNPELGLHLHCNSMTRNPEVYKTIAAYAVSLMDRFSLRISFLDIGGGFFGGVPGKTKPAEYFSVIVEQLRQANTRSDYQLIAEPGSALIGSTVELHTSVLDIKDIEKSRIVTTDGSRICIDPLWSKKGYTYRTQPIRTEKTERRQVICGYTCMDHDRLMVIENGPALHVGDQIIYERVGAYSMTFGGPFIRNYPDVFVLDENGMEKIRDRFSVDTYYKLHTCFLDGE